MSQLALDVSASWVAFLHTYEPLRADLYRYARKLTRSPWDAEDLVQDTLARAFLLLGQVREAPANPKAWLLRVASNLWIDRARRARREEPLAIDARPLSPISVAPARRRARSSSSSRRKNARRWC